MRKPRVRLAGFVIALLGICTGCFSFRESDRTLHRTMAKEGLAYEIHYDPSDSLRWLWYKQEKPEAPVLLFIHGAPGSSSSFLSYLKNERLREAYSLLVVDRPGYGYSEYGSYRPIPKQYQAIQRILELSGITDNVVTIGHSFGGTISGYIAIHNPDWLAGTVMIAPAIDPEQEKYLWFGKLALYPATRWMAPRSLRVAADEKYSHEEELHTFINDWHRIHKPVLHIHGDADGLVPYGNVTFSQKKIPSEWLEVKTIENKGHLIPFTERETMIDEIIRFVSTLDTIQTP
ncbi:Pimeloyl-ACP methyl ester carboxylesterase [Cyclobacterium xiamenense]|uniref:Pimeloyl-ACP methyl ester carboxylesterase n=1 Tax=Cyclobacterium xiamenense TaxID=1297121 RepID=A0A1H6W6W4_9BACT|nr:alpha/beta hydrolase [Cyclobacterium xiamenense]SEJ10974.1 Pimeloyl-ACP methyl ester carboxylesterase [Cyclobacterium xiamenense]